MTLPKMKANKSCLRRAQVHQSHKEKHSTEVSGKGPVDQFGKESHGISLPMLRHYAIAWLHEGQVHERHRAAKEELQGQSSSDKIL